MIVMKSDNGSEAGPGTGKMTPKGCNRRNDVGRYGKGKRKRRDGPLLLIETAAGALPSVRFAILNGPRLGPLIRCQMSVACGL